MAEKRWLVITPSQIRGVATADGAVVVELDVSDRETGLAPGLGLMVRLTPTEARHIARLLDNMADAAEAGSPRA